MQIYIISALLFSFASTNSVNNSMKALISQLTGSDAAVQVAASGCIVNISAGTSNHCDIALKSAAVYLVSFLDGQNSLLKVSLEYYVGNVSDTQTLYSSSIKYRCCECGEWDRDGGQAGAYMRNRILPNHLLCMRRKLFIEVHQKVDDHREEF